MNLIEQIVHDLHEANTPLCREAAIVIEHLSDAVEEYEEQTYFDALTIRALERDLGISGQN
jgi:hypothetical protein